MLKNRWEMETSRFGLNKEVGLLEKPANPTNAFSKKMLIKVTNLQQGLLVGGLLIKIFEICKIKKWRLKGNTYDL